MANYNRKLFLKLKKADRAKIDEILTKGKHSVRVVKRAQILRMLERGFSANKIAPLLGCTPETARRTGWKYVRGNLGNAIEEPSRPGKARALNEKQSNQIVAMVCGQPPDRYARWTIELATAEAKRRKIVQSVGSETIRILLRSHDHKPWREKNVVHTRRSG